MAKRMISGIMAFVMTLCLCANLAWSDNEKNAYAACNVPCNASVTKANVMSVAKEYDKDAAYLLNWGFRYDDPLSWFNQKSIYEGIDISVHETFHAYSVSGREKNSEWIYAGNGKKNKVTYTKVFDTKQIASSIPKKLRTFRYSTYIDVTDENMASNKEGVYGLLNEYSAYYYGMKTQMAMFDYLKDQKASVDDYAKLVQLSASDRLAYAEFRYYILSYMLYAKGKYPDIYKKIVKNKSFTTTFSLIDRKFYNQVNDMDSLINDVVSICKKAGYSGSKYESGKLIIATKSKGKSYGLLEEDYKKLTKEINKDKYQEILKDIGGYVYVSDGKVSSVKYTGKGVSVKWSKSKNANYYYVYRKVKGKTKYSKIKTTASTSYTDKTAKAGKTYSYMITPVYKSKLNGSISKGNDSKVKKVKIPVKKTK